MLFASSVAAILALLMSMPLLLGIFLLLCSVSLLLWSVFQPQFQTWDAYRHRDASAEIAAFTYRFEEEALHILHPTHAQTVSYTDITGCTETEAHFVLFAGRQVFCLAKDTVVKGTIDELRTLFMEHTVYTAVKLAGASRRRGMSALTVAIVTVALAIGIRGVTYVRRPVTVMDEGHRLVLSLPRFMKDQGDGEYIGNGIDVKTEYLTKAMMEERIEPVLEDAAANIANYASYLQKTEAVPAKGEWVAVSETEYYMSYADGASYRYTILRADADGVWAIWFRSPGERQDTYYNRFDTWREDIYTK